MDMCVSSRNHWESYGEVSGNALGADEPGPKVVHLAVLWEGEGQSGSPANPLRPRTRAGLSADAQPGQIGNSGRTLGSW